MNNTIKIALGVVAALWLLGRCSGCGEDYENYEDCEVESITYSTYGDAYVSFVGEYIADLTIMQSGKTSKIVLNSDGTGYTQQGSGSYDRVRWRPADNGGGIVIVSVGSSDGYYMNKRKTKMYWGLDNYMNDENSYAVKKIN